MNPFEPPVERPARKQTEPLKMRLVAVAIAAVGLWHVFVGLSELHPIGWGRLFAAGVCFGFAVLAWKR